MATSISSTPSRIPSPRPALHLSRTSNWNLYAMERSRENWRCGNNIAHLFCFDFTHKTDKTNIPRKPPPFMSMSAGGAEARGVFACMYLAGPGDGRAEQSNRRSNSIDILPFVIWCLLFGKFIVWLFIAVVLLACRLRQMNKINGVPFAMLQLR